MINIIEITFEVWNITTYKHKKNKIKYKLGDK